MKRTDFSDTEIEFVLNLGEKVLLKKGTTFSYRNLHWQQFGIMESGILGGWKYDENGDKKLVQFYFLPDNYVVVDYECHVEGIPAMQTIDVLADAAILVFSKENFFELKKRFPNFLRLEKITAERKYIESQKLVRMFQNCDATERIRLLQKSAPEIMSKIPYSYIASFLGLHRNTFAQALKKA